MFSLQVLKYSILNFHQQDSSLKRTNIYAFTLLNACDDTAFRFRILRFHIIQQNIHIPCKNTEIGVFRILLVVQNTPSGSEYP